MSDMSESGSAPVDKTPKEQTAGAVGGQSAANAAKKPKIGDSRPAPAGNVDAPAGGESDGGRPNGQPGGEGSGTSASARRRRRRRKKSTSGGEQPQPAGQTSDGDQSQQQSRNRQNDGESGRRAQGGGDQPEGGQGGRSRRGQNQGGQSQADENQGRQSKGGQRGQKQGGQNKGGQNPGGGGRKRRRSRSGGRTRSTPEPVGQILADGAVELDEDNLKQRRGRSRKGRPVGRYLMVVSKQADATHIAVLEGRTLIEYYVSRPTDNVFQIHGNIYLGRVQNVLPGMEAAFVDIGTPKNAVIYRGDVQYDKDDYDGNSQPKIEQMLRARQSILCQVSKNPIAHKGARLTAEVSLPGRFVVLVPNSDTYGISKRLPDDERKRLRQILDKARPKGHGLIVRTAAENVTGAEIERDIAGLMQQWTEIEKRAKKAKAPELLYQEPQMSTRVVREEFNKEFRGVVLDDPGLFEEVADYVTTITPALADRVEYFDRSKEKLALFERYHVHEQLHKALDRKVWLPSGGSLIIESTEALTVIDVNTGKNVGSSNLEDTVFRNNLEAAEGIAQQLRLRDIGGIIVIDFVDMEAKKNRDEVMRVFRKALSRDKTRTQVFDISDLGLAEMTRKRIGEGLLESLSVSCPHCEGRGVELTDDVLPG